MERQVLPINVMASLIKPTKTRQEIYDEYEMSYKIFIRKLKFHKIILPPGVITPKYQEMIYEAFGSPPSIVKEKGKEKKGK